MSLDLSKLKNKLDEALSNETSETLNKFLNDKRMTNNKQQTAVEWLVEQMFKQGYFDGNKPLTFTNLDHLQQQAKEMEKEQIMDAYSTGADDEYEHHVNLSVKREDIDCEKYYNETYGK